MIEPKAKSAVLCQNTSNLLCNSIRYLFGTGLDITTYILLVIGCSMASSAGDAGLLIKGLWLIALMTGIHHSYRWINAHYENSAKAFLGALLIMIILSIVTAKLTFGLA